MNITRIRDAHIVDLPAAWYELCSIRTLYVYTAISIVVALVISALTFKVTFRYNGCKW